MISVIVPIYNVENYLAACVDSILNSTYQDIEVILVDDGSPDGSGAICDRYAEKDSRVKVVHKTNGGLSDARNCGLDHATGDYIIFVDGDDLIHPQSLERNVKALESGDYDFSVSYIVPVDEKECARLIQMPMGDQLKTRVIDYDEYVRYLFDTNTQIDMTHFVSATNKLYKRSFLGNMRFKKMSVEDLEWCNRLCLRMNKIILIEEGLYFWVQQPSSITHAKRYSQMIDHIDCYDSCLAEIPEDKSSQKALCLNALYRRIVNSRYNLRNTPYLNEATERGDKAHKKYANQLRHCELPWVIKASLLTFYHMPALYSTYRNLMALPYKLKLMK